MPDINSSTSVRYMLTNTGHKRVLERRKDWSPVNNGDKLMQQVAVLGVACLSRTSLLDALIEDGMVAAVADDMSAEMALLRYKQNPLENVERCNFEITNLCNFTCQHCRNGGVEPASETDLNALKRAADLMLSIGVRRYDFIGGEVSRFGNGWLELADHITEADQRMDWQRGLIVTLYSNGWWLDQRDFEAAGRYYRDDREYLEDLKAHGITHILFSIDGPEELHDSWRGHSGLFRRIFSGLKKVRQAGISPRISVIGRPQENYRYLRPFARRIYNSRTATPQMLLTDQTNLFCNFIDSARGASMRKGYYKLSELNPDLIRCKAFFRPWPTIRIMASGALGICPIMQGQEQYGSIHRQSLGDLLNNLQEAPLYQLHASGEIGKYLQLIDNSQFGSGYDHLCAVRRAVNLRALQDQV